MGVVQLNGYGYQYLDGQDLEKWESHLENDEDSFTKLFDITKINYSTFSEFFEYFIIRKVSSGESFMKRAVRVMKKLIDWLFENNTIDQDEFDDLKDYFEGGKSTTLSNAEKVSDLVYDLSRKEEFEYDEN